MGLTLGDRLTGLTAMDEEVVALAQGYPWLWLLMLHRRLLWLWLSPYLPFSFSFWFLQPRLHFVLRILAAEKQLRLKCCVYTRNVCQESKYLRNDACREANASDRIANHFCKYLLAKKNKPWRYRCHLGISPFYPLDRMVCLSLFL